MAEHNTIFSEGSILGVLTDFIHCVREMVLNGNTVKLDNLAIFKATVEANGLETLYDASADKVASATLGTLKEGDKTGSAIKVIKLLAQSTGDFTREELKKDVKLSWTDKTKAEIAAAKGGSTNGGNDNQNENPGGGSTTNGGNENENQNPEPGTGGNPSTGGSGQDDTGGNGGGGDADN